MAEGAQTDPGKSWRSATGIPVVPAFDGYRTLAVGGVVLFHVLQVCGVLVEAGDSAAGVIMWGVLPQGSLTMLFIVSGFVMFLPAAARAGDLGSVRVFAVRRAARLVPAYWLCLAASLALLAAFSPHPSAPGFPGLDQVLAHLVLIQTPLLLVDGPVTLNGISTGDFQLGLGVIPPVWTLSVEVGFYLVLPLVAGAFYRRPFTGLAITGAVLVGWTLAASNIGSVAAAVGIHVGAITEARFADYFANQLPSWGLSLAAGMACAWVYVKARDRLSPSAVKTLAARALVVLGPALLLVFYLAGRDAVTDPNPFRGLFARQPIGLSLVFPVAMAATMIAFALAPERIQRPLTNRPVRWLADISYGVYLVHFAVLWLIIAKFSLPVGSIPSALLWCSIVFPASVLYAYLSARFVERPARRWAHQFRDRTQGTRAPRTAEARQSPG